MKKIFLSLLLITTLFLGSGQGFLATDTKSTLSYEEYEELVREGIYGEDITYEMAQLLTGDPQLDDLLTSDEFTSFQATASYTPEYGDILVTNSTSSKGLTGHSGIVTVAGVLHISGPNANPKAISWSTWIKNYPKTNVYRPKDGYKSMLAAIWIQDIYLTKNPNAKYQVNTKLYTYNETYCSKIVWQAYAVGVKEYGSTPAMDKPFGSVAAPYNLDNYLNISYTTPRKDF